jgi:HTH domain
MSACSAISSPRPSSAAYIPELAAKLDDDSRLTDGARRCGRKIAELAYRRNREGRALEITVSYLMNALERSRRTVQGYLRQLEACGYIAVEVVVGWRSRLCTGLGRAPAENPAAAPWLAGKARKARGAESCAEL